MQQFHGFNLTLESPFVLPGAIPLPAPIKAPDLRIDVTVADVEASAVLSVEGSDILHYVPGIAHFRSTPATIDVSLGVGADPEMVAALLIATAIPACLWQRGKLQLHAATVVPRGRGRGLAIVGPRGAGKSTLARSFIAAGAALLSDDCLAVDCDESGARASGLPGGLFRQRAGGSDRLFDAVPAKQQLLRAPLGAIVVLSNDRHQPSLIQLDPIKALEVVLANCHRARIPALLGRQREMLVQAGRLVRSIAVFQLSRRQCDTPVHAAEMGLIESVLDRT